MAAKKKAGKKDIDDGEEALQAVLLADSFRKRMTPITYTTPKSLLPLVNVPILEYTLELLVSAGVKELFIVCCCHAEKIQEYVENSASCKQFQVSIIVAPACKSVGAAMREVDSRGKIRGDFILVNGDVVSNMKLEPALLAHKKRREEEKNKDAILTMVFKTVHPSHKTSLFPEDDVCIAINPETNRLVHYQSMSSKGCGVDVTVFAAHPTVQVLYDRQYTHVCICSPEVLCLFTDEFDWQDFHADFVPGVLTSEILSYQIYTHTAVSGYAGRVNCFNSYDLVSKDIIRRWSFPLVPDVNLFLDTSYAYVYPGIYKEQGVTLAQSCVVGSDCVIGSKTTVGDGARVTRSVIGRGCSVGARADVQGSYIFANVMIEDDVTVIDSVLCDGVKLRRGAVVNRNCVLGAGVEIAAGFAVAEGKRLTVADPPKDAGSDEEDGFDSDKEEDTRVAGAENDASEVGAGGRGRLWRPEGDEAEAADVTLIMDRRAAAEKPGADGGYCDEGPDSDSDADTAAAEAGRAGSPGQEAAGGGGGGGGGGGLTFEQEVEDIVKRGVEEDVQADNIAMEVNGRKFAHDKTFGDCSVVIVSSVLQSLPPAASRKEAFAGATALIKKWKGLIKKFTRNTADQTRVIQVLEAFVVMDQWKAHKLMMPILKALYDEDIVEEDAILDWATDSESSGSAQTKQLCAECKQLIEFLQQDDDEDDDDLDE